MDRRERPEPIYFSKDTEIKIIPPHFETLWQIAQEVAERDSTYGENVGFDDLPEVYCCPFLHCDGELTRTDHNHGKTFPHSTECIVTKARELMEWRKSQPQFSVTHAEVLPSMEESAKQIVERFNISPPLVGPVVVDAEGDNNV